MHNLYARFVLFLIRPALRVDIANQSGAPITATTKMSADEMGKLVVDVMLADLRKNGPYRRSIRGDQ